MNTRPIASFLFTASLFGVGSLPIASLTAAEFKPSAIQPPEVSREFRGAWVATVSNIDWPSKKGLTPAEQRTELIAILDRAQQLRLNAIVLQVRPACDALYPSQLEPWSEYLSGTMGVAPSPVYDPLAFAVTEAHKRGLELHAWFNPYRARHVSAKSPVSDDHISKTRPELVRSYGGYLWLDPGEPAVQEHSINVIMDVVKRYDIDGVHMDDYFYPYQVQGSDGKYVPFPDSASWQKYVSAGGKLARDDWRRQNVDQLIDKLYQRIKAEKPHVKFGLSPFGIWRPGNPAQIRGYDAYAMLYADAKKWLANGWLDYISPQLYWAIDPPQQSYPVLMKWWGEQNLHKRHLWPGINSTKVPATWNASEIERQIQLTREYSGADGNIHWNMKSLMRDNGVGSSLPRTTYRSPALVPASPWLSKKQPATPEISVTSEPNQIRISWKSPGTTPARFFVLQTRAAGNWTTEILPGAQTSVVLKQNQPDAVAVRTVDQFGTMSRATTVARQ